MVKRLLKYHNEKGITLIELIVSMAILSIVMILVLGIFFTGSKIYRDIYSYTEIQQQGHFIMDFMSGIVMNSSGVESIVSEQGVVLSQSDKRVNVAEIKFKDNALDENETHIFSIQKDPKMEGRSIRYGRKKPITIEAGNYISGLYVSPLPKESMYKDARGIKLTLHMEKGDKTLEIFKNIYFRN